MTEQKEVYEIEAIAHYRGPLREKFGLPRQAGLAEKLEGEVVFTEAFSDMVAARGLENYSHIWLIWSFSAVPEGRQAHTVRPPRLKGNERMGVLATRSPFRPNRLGLSCVKLEKVGPGPRLQVRGADLLDGTPIFDIKPYIPYADAKPEAEALFAKEAPPTLEVSWPDCAKEMLTQDELEALTEILAQDPRPAYQNDPEREYGLCYKNFNVRFKVADRVRVISLGAAR